LVKQHLAKVQRCNTKTQVSPFRSERIARQKVLTFLPAFSKSLFIKVVIIKFLQLRNTFAILFDF
jgi:hypothetical protein